MQGDSDTNTAATAIRSSPTSRRPRGGLILGVPLWALVFSLVVPALATLFPRASMRADLLSNLSAQFLIATVIVGVIALALRRRRAAVLCLLLALVHSALLLSGRGAILPRGPADASRSRADRAAQNLVRVMIFNASREQTQREMVEEIRALQPDIVGILEPSSFLWMSRDDLLCDLSRPASETTIPSIGPSPTDLPASELNTSHVLRRYAFWSRRTPESPQVLLGEGVLISRWALEAMEPVRDTPYAASLLAAVVRPELDQGYQRPAFAVILLHPPSPRSVERWLAGNEVVEAAVEMASAARQAGLPVILLADLNSTPTGWRSRRLAQAGFRRAKPLLMPLGTWPTHAALNTAGSGLPDRSPPGASTSAFQPDPDDRVLVGRWPLAIAIDDAWVSEEWRVAGWSRGPSRGSDHWSVVVDVRLGK